MDSKKKAIIIVAVVVVLVAAVFAAQALNDKHEEGKESDVTFLIQDDKGVYFWIDGKGETVYDAFVDAADKFDIPFVPSENSYGKGIQSLFGLGMNQVSEKEWVYWQQYSYKDGAWVLNDVTMEKIAAADAEYTAIVYGGYGAQVAVTDVSKAKVWDFSTEGTVFTVESNTGLYYRINGVGETVFDAWTNAAEIYSVPFVPSDKSYGKGIESMYGLKMVQEESGNYSYWTQYEIVDGAWGYASATMEKLKSDSCSQFLIVYSLDGKTPELVAPL